MNRQLILFFVAFWLVATCACDNARERAKRAAVAEKEESRARIVEKVNALIDRQDADVNWLDVLDGYDLFTIDLEEALIKRDSQSKLAFGQIRDIETSEDGYLLTISDAAAIHDVYFRLACSRELLESVLTDPRDEEVWIDVAVAFVPTAIRRPFAIGAESDEPYTAYPTLSYGDLFVVEGNCIEVLDLEGQSLDAGDFAVADDRN